MTTTEPFFTTEPEAPAPAPGDDDLFPDPDDPAPTPDGDWDYELDPIAPAPAPGDDTFTPSPETETVSFSYVFFELDLSMMEDEAFRDEFILEYTSDIEASLDTLSDSAVVLGLRDASDLGTSVGGVLVDTAVLFLGDSEGGYSSCLFACLGSFSFVSC
jgi:hypothetical protein